MGKKIKITRKQLKQDEVKSYWLEFVAWAQKNQRPLMIGTAALVVLILAFNMFRSRGHARSDETNFLVSRAQIEIQSGLLRDDPQMRQRLLDDAEDKLRQVVDIYGRSDLAPYATYLLGNIAFYRNQYDQAERYYRDYLDMASKPVDKAEAHIALGYTYENKFFWTQELDDRSLLDRALENYREAEQLTSGTTQHYVAMLGRARLLDLQMGRQDEARALYERIERERKLEPIKHSDEAGRSQYSWLLSEVDRMKRLYALSETARLRLDRLEAEGETEPLQATVPKPEKPEMPAPELTTGPLTGTGPAADLMPIPNLEALTTTTTVP